MKNLFFVGLMANLWLAKQSHAQLVTFDFEGESNSPSFVANGLQSSDFSLSSGTVSFPAGNESEDSINATGWNVSDPPKFWEFTICLDQPTDRFNLNSLSFDDRRSSSGPASWSISINQVPLLSNQATHDTFTGSPMNFVDLTPYSLSDLTSATIRIEGHGASASSGTWRLDNVHLNGEITPVPEPSQTVWIATACIIGWLGYRQLKRESASP